MLRKYTDVTIVGGGPAGIAAAIELHRLGFNPLIVERVRLGGQLRAARYILDYPGFSHGIKGAVLAERMEAQVQVLGIDVIEDDVLSVERCDNFFEIMLKSSFVRSRCIVIAIGQSPKLLGLPFEKEDLGQKVWYYPVPADIPHKERRLLIVGGGDAAFDQALSFIEGGASVAIAIKGEEPRATPQFVKMVEQKNVKIIKNANSSLIKFDGVHFQYDNLTFDYLIACAGKAPELSILNGLAGDTRGCFLAGDCARGRDRHVALAVGDGVAAAYKVKGWVTREA